MRAALVIYILHIYIIVCNTVCILDIYIMYVYKCIHTYLGPFQGCSGVCVFFGVTSIPRFVDSPPRKLGGGRWGCIKPTRSIWRFPKIGGTPKDP